MGCSISQTRSGVHGERWAVPSVRLALECTERDGLFHQSDSPWSARLFWWDLVQLVICHATAFLKWEDVATNLVPGDNLPMTV
ncbi:hypothetical protein ElyMa_003015900 [Elysia marginata]|uniref:Uncharacterized protein n=1 Tax=Elysia marginata TaxID=1093978 RepID=A0AAV4IDB9_9GAST|nr:hypothetical protein ElyMa_003015900 [Elysia marginata]